jgi:hypothetical protein
MVDGGSLNYSILMGVVLWFFSVGSLLLRLVEGDYWFFGGVAEE